MSLLKQYIAESVKTYNFKIKIAGDLREDILEKMNVALKKYDCDGAGKGKRTPIQESPLDFPEMKNTHVTIFDIECRYPVTSHVLTQYLAEKLSMSASCIRVRSPGEEAEIELNSLAIGRVGQNSTQALLNQPYENSDNQKLVGDKRNIDFLKELDQFKHSGEAYKGVNDQLLAKDAPKEKMTVDVNIGTTSPIGSKKTGAFVDPYKGR
jgi:hypothetical protein